MPRQVSAEEASARLIFASPAGKSAQTLYDLARKLEKANNIEYARRLLDLASQAGASGDLRIAIEKQLGKCTYKSPDQPLADRLTRAEGILKRLLDDTSLPDGERQDTLGILGAVYKQRWSAFGNKDQLEK